MTPEEIHRATVKSHVTATLALGVTDFHEVLARCQGADPQLVDACLKEIGNKTDRRDLERTPTRELFVRLPAADPFRSQWWFTGETVDHLSRRVVAAADTGRILSLGTPTVGHELARAGADVVVLDVDQHVVDAVNERCPRPVAQCYDVADELPEALRTTFR